MTFALCGNLVAKAVLTSGTPRQHSEQLTTMKLLFLLLQCLPSLIHCTQLLHQRQLPLYPAVRHPQDFHTLCATGDNQCL